MTAEERRGAAYHEAGHAIVGLKLGLSLSKIEIGLRGDDSAGMTTFHDDTKLLQPVGRIAICLAGEEAQRIFGAPLSSRRPPHLFDWYEADKLLEGLLKNEALDLERGGRELACQILKSNEKEVHQLAGALIEYGKVDYDAPDSR